MAIRILAILTVSIGSISSFATVPLVTAERASNKAIADADFSRTTAEMELAQWKLTQLEALQSRGHASWQEVAEQLVTVKAAAAGASEAKQLLQFISESLARSNDSSSPQTVDTEVIRLYMPGSARLVGWIPAEQASHQLVARQLENLTAAHKALSNIDFAPYVTAIEKAERSVEAYSRAPRDAHHLRRAKIQLRLAKAEYDLAQARKENAAIVFRRIELLRNSQAKSESPASASSIAKIGTTFVDLTSDRELAELVITMANEETTSIAHLEWLKQRREAATSRIAKLEELSKYPAADARELEQARAGAAAIDGLLHDATAHIQMHEQVATAYEARSLPMAKEKGRENSAIASDRLGDATMVRHMLQLQQLRLHTNADAEIVEAHRSYLVERMTRLERIDRTARLTNELDDLRQKIKATELRRGTLLGHLAFLRREKQRFLCQVTSQLGENFQLVQAADGKFFDRRELAAGAAVIGAVGFVGDHSTVLPKSSETYAYLESTAILGCVTGLTTDPQSRVTVMSGIAMKGSSSDALRAGRQSSLWKTPASGGLRLATDGITYPRDLFCYSPHELWKLYPGYPISTRGYLRSVSSFRSPSWKTPPSSGLRLATDGITYHSDLFCYSPHELWNLHRRDPASRRDYLRSASSFRSRLPSYSSEYAFGIRRLDIPSARYRRRASAYGGPWYLPGSPTNYRD